MSDFVTAQHYSQVRPEDWPWKSFSPAEVASRGDGSIKISRALMDKLQALRTRLGAPILINSAYRDPVHNRKVGGAKDSFHMRGLAIDCSMANHDPQAFEAAALACGFTGFGFYPPKHGNFIHLDIGPARTWGARWAAPKFQPEAKPATAKKAGAGLGAAAIATGVVEAVKPDNLRAVQEVVQPMIAFAPIFQTVFAAAGFGLVAWLFWNRFVKKAP